MSNSSVSNVTTVSTASTLETASKSTRDLSHKAETPRYSDQSILACIDGSNVTTSVCDYAAWYANELGISVNILHVIDDPKSNRHDLSGAIGLDSRKNLLKELAILDEQKARIANKHGEALLIDAKNHILSRFPEENIHIHLRRSKLLPAINHYIKHSRIVILGRRGEDHQDDHVNIGSQIESVVRAVDRPIMICSEQYQKPDSYLFAFDGSPTAKKAIQLIYKNQIAKKLRGHIVMVDNLNASHEDELHRAQALLSKAGFNITAHIIDSKKQGYKDIATALTSFRRDNNISMIIMGAYGHSKIRQFIVGSTTTKLLTKTTAPVLLLK